MCSKSTCVRDAICSLVKPRELSVNLLKLNTSYFLLHSSESNRLFSFLSWYELQLFKVLHYKDQVSRVKLPGSSPVGKVLQADSKNSSKMREYMAVDRAAFLFACVTDTCVLYSVRATSAYDKT